jgi:ubiquinone/menaquinone biosynthesis C-methylase UbiE
MMDNLNTNKSASNPERYDRIAREVFLPIFPVIARKALDIYGFRDGVCLDIGSGGGMFGYNVALQSRMSIQFLDIQAEAIDVCRRRGQEWGLLSRSAYAIGDVHAIPLPSDTYPLIVSRGSIKFWGDCGELTQAFKEIYRVLAPGGKTLIGNSLGPPEMQAAIEEKMKIYNPAWVEERKSGKSCFSFEERKKILDALEIPYQIVDDDSGTWFVLQK